MLLVYVPSPVPPHALVLQHLTVSHETTAAEAVTMLLTQGHPAKMAPAPATAARFCLALCDATGQERRVAGDTRPLLMQARWDAQGLRLVLRHAGPMA